MSDISVAHAAVDLSFGTVDNYMCRHARRTGESRKTPSVYMRLPGIVGDPHYLIGSQVFVVRPLQDKKFSDFLLDGQVMVGCRAALLGIDPDNGQLCEHPVERCLADLDPTSHSATEVTGCTLHKGLGGLARHCDFSAEAITHYLPTAGCNFGC